MARVHTVREHDTLVPSPNLSREDIADLSEFARKALKRSDGNLAASSYVGVVTTRRGAVLEILPKIDLDDADDPPHERTRQLFLQMLRFWRRLALQMPQSDIRAMSRFPMLEVFVRQFLNHLTAVTRSGLAKRYITVEENLPYLRGRLLIRDDLRENLSNRARFYGSHDELSVNRPANRLIHRAIVDLLPRVRDSGNQQLLRQALIALADVPLSHNVPADWRAHHVDRSVRHYGPIMQWVELFIFNRGLATYSGPHANISLLFRMEQVFEDFVTASFRRHQRRYTVVRQGPRKYMATIDGRNAFATEPDIALQEKNNVVFVVDAKWKRIYSGTEDPKHGIEQDDLYQLHAYGARYNCKAVALIYPKSRSFGVQLHYRFFDDTTLVAIPFDVTQPEQSVCRTVQTLENV